MLLLDQAEHAHKDRLVSDESAPGGTSSTWTATAIKIVPPFNSPNSWVSTAQQMDWIKEGT
jgi:hypothetical protein